ncbi:MAG: aminotransferase class III-fold pyridoxal phosphate-dependent enzyme [Rikenellaceae bacterium]
MNLFDVYPLYAIEPVRGEGSYVYDSEGVEYLDLYGGHAVISVGHAHPHYVAKLTDQLTKLAFYSNSVENSLQGELAEKLGCLSGYDDYALFLCNSGAEANENAIKVASFAKGKAKVLAFKKAFHGRTSGAVALTDNPKIVSPFNETDHVTFVALNDIEAVRTQLATGEYCAVIIEGIQGVAGIHTPDPEFMQQLREATKAADVALILDEIQSGYGRTGRFFAHQWAGVKADIVTTAKGMANGFPIGGVLISPDFKPSYGMLGTTFGGNHLACAAAIAVLDIFAQEKLVENAEAIGAYLIEELGKIEGIKEVRGQGLMIGIEIEGSASELRKKLLFDHKIFTGGAGATTVRLLPALNVGRKEADRFLEVFKTML